MRKNPDLVEKPDCGHYDACCTRMLEIKAFSKKLFIYTGVSGVILLFFTIIGVYEGPFSLLPSLLGEPSEVSYLFTQSLIILSLVVFTGLGFFGSKIYHVFVFLIYTAMLIGCFFAGMKAFKSIGIVFDVLGILLSFKSVGNYADYKQLYSTEGFPYFSRLFEIKEDTSYKAFYAEQYKKLPKNPERRFGDNGPLPKTPEQEMLDLSAAPMEKTVKGHSSSDDDEKKSYFEEV